MKLPLPDAEQFLRLHESLMFYINRQLEVVKKKVATIEAYREIAPKDRFEVHKALPAHLDLIDRFVDENPSDLDEAELEIVRSWKHHVTGEFYLYRYLRNYSVFLTMTDPIVAYGVIALFDPLEDLLGPELPRMVKTTLLPFKGRIIYDGLLSHSSVTFGAGFKRGLAEDYRGARERSGIITSLPATPEKMRPAIEAKSPRAAPAPAPAKRKSSTTAATVKPALDQIVALTDAFCRDHLDEEYADLCRRLAGVLSRKRPSPLVRGKPESWACGIVRAIGWVNFLGDPSLPHHMKTSDIDKAFGVSEATGTAKSLAIRDLIRMDRFEVEWTLPSLMDRNPMIWMLSVNGLMMDIRLAPREVQVIAFEQGLIPYIPADRVESSDRT